MNKFPDFQSQNLQEFFKGKTLLITGCTGFVGKGVLEKILRSFDTKMIYIMIRSQNNINPAERFQKQIIQSNCFERLRQEKGQKFQQFIENRTQPIFGDLCEDELGLEPSIKQNLQSTVQIIVNSAANIDLHLPLKQALEYNFYGNLRIMQFATGCKHLNQLIHISTAYVNSNQKGLIQEKIYDEKQNILEYVQNVYNQADLMSELEIKKLLNGIESTYMYAKNLAEQMYKQLKPENMSLSIIRPSCVGCAISEPQPGWIDNLATQGGVILNVGLGYLKMLKCDKNIQICNIPIDIFVDQVIGVIWFDSNKQKFKIYHSGSSYDNPNYEYLKQLETKGIEFWNKYQVRKRVGPPKVILTNNQLYYDFKYLQIMWMLNLSLKIAENFGSYESIKQAQINIKNFKKSDKISKIFEKIGSSNAWIFESINIRAVIDQLRFEKQLNMDVKGINWKQYFILYNYGIQKFMLGEKINLKDVIEDQFLNEKILYEKPKL